MTYPTCSTCARADCKQAGLVEVCDKWSNTDDVTEAEMDRDLVLLSRYIGEFGKK